MNNYVYQNIKKYADQNHTDINTITALLGISESELKAWDTKLPLNQIILIANLLNVQIQDLLLNDNENNETAHDQSHSDEKLKDIQLPLTKIMEINDNVFVDTNIEWGNRKIDPHEAEANSYQVLKIKDSLERYSLANSYVDFLFGFKQPLISFAEFENKLRLVLDQLGPNSESVYNPEQTKLYVHNLEQAIRPEYEAIYDQMQTKAGESNDANV